MTLEIQTNPPAAAIKKKDDLMKGPEGEVHVGFKMPSSLLE